MPVSLDFRGSGEWREYHMSYAQDRWKDGRVLSPSICTRVWGWIFLGLNYSVNKRSSLRISKEFSLFENAISNPQHQQMQKPRSSLSLTSRTILSATLGSKFNDLRDYLSFAATCFVTRICLPTSPPDRGIEASGNTEPISTPSRSLLWKLICHIKSLIKH